VDEFGGRVVKHIGDEIMCVFADPNDAVNAACQMQERVTAPAEELELTIHIGLHWGPVLVERGDVFGDAVNLAARMVSLAHPRQVLTTDETVQALEPALRNTARVVDRRHVKGKHGDIDIYEVVWEQSEERTEFKGVGPPQRTLTELRVVIGSVELRGNTDKPAVTIGRGEVNDVVIHDQAASRRHAKFERLTGKWVLTDHSSNGTFLAGDDGASVLIHNEQILLPTAGWVGIGAPDPGAELPVRFELLRPKQTDR
jgi:hypothetical protein